MQLKTIIALSISLIAGVSLVSAEVLTDQVYSAPGLSYNWTPTGTGGGSGEHFAYANITLDPSLYSALYWGPVEVDNVINSNQSSTGQMTYAGFNGSSYVFNSTSTWEGYNTRMTLTTSGLGAEDLESNLEASTAPLYPLFRVTGDYSVDFTFQAETGVNTWTVVDTVYNDLPPQDKIGGVQDETSVDFHFFTAAAATPEPGTFFLLGSGGVLMGLYRRRARR